MTQDRPMMSGGSVTTRPSRPALLPVDVAGGNQYSNLVDKVIVHLSHLQIEIPDDTPDEPITMLRVVRGSQHHQEDEQKDSPSRASRASAPRTSTWFLRDAFVTPRSSEAPGASKHAPLEIGGLAGSAIPAFLAAAIASGKPSRATVASHPLSWSTDTSTTAPSSLDTTPSQSPLVVPAASPSFLPLLHLPTTPSAAPLPAPTDPGRSSGNSNSNSSSPTLQPAPSSSPIPQGPSPPRLFLEALNGASNTLQTTTGQQSNTRSRSVTFQAAGSAEGSHGEEEAAEVSRSSLSLSPGSSSFDCHESCSSPMERRPNQQQQKRISFIDLDRKSPRSSRDNNISNNSSSISVGSPGGTGTPSWLALAPEPGTSSPRSSLEQLYAASEVSSPRETEGGQIGGEGGAAADLLHHRHQERTVAPTLLNASWSTEHTAGGRRPGASSQGLPSRSEQQSPRGRVQHEHQGMATTAGLGATAAASVAASGVLLAAPMGGTPEGPRGTQSQENPPMNNSSYEGSSPHSPSRAVQIPGAARESPPGSPQSSLMSSSSFASPLGSTSPMFPEMLQAGGFHHMVAHGGDETPAPSSSSATPSQAGQQLYQHQQLQQQQKQQVIGNQAEQQQHFQQFHQQQRKQEQQELLQEQQPRLNLHPQFPQQQQQQQQQQQLQEVHMLNQQSSANPSITPQDPVAASVAQQRAVGAPRVPPLDGVSPHGMLPVQPSSDAAAEAAGGAAFSSRSVDGGLLFDPEQQQQQLQGVHSIDRLIFSPRAAPGAGGKIGSFVFDLRPSVPLSVGGSLQPVVWVPPAWRESLRPHLVTTPLLRRLAAEGETNSSSRAAPGAGDSSLVAKVKGMIASGDADEGEAAAAAIATMAPSAELRRSMWEISGCPAHLAALLRGPGAASGAAAAANLGCSAQLRREMMDSGLPRALAATAVDGRSTDSAASGSFRALANLACHPQGAAAVGRSPEVVSRAVAMAMAGGRSHGAHGQAGSEEGRLAALSVLANAAFDAEGRGAVTAAGGAEAATAVLRELGPKRFDALQAAILVLWNLATEEPGRAAILAAGGADPVVKLLRPGFPVASSSSDGVQALALRQAAVGVVGKLSLSPEGAAAVESAGGIAALSGLLLSEAAILEQGDSSYSSSTGTRVRPAEVALREGVRALIALATDERRASALVTVGATAPLCVLLTNRSASRESRESAARGLWLLFVTSRWEAAAEALQRGVVAPLQEMLTDSGSPASQASAAKALANMSLEPAALAAIGEAGAIQPLVEMLRPSDAPSPGRGGGSTGSTRAAAASALANLCANPNNCAAVASLDGIPLLVEMIRGHRDASSASSASSISKGFMAREAATRALVNLAAASNDRRTRIAAAGAIPHLVEVLQDWGLTSAGTPEGAALLEAACSCLANLMRTEPLKQQVADAGALTPLIYLAKFPPCPGVLRGASASLRLLSALPGTQRDIRALVEAAPAPQGGSYGKGPGLFESFRTGKSPSKAMPSSPPTLAPSGYGETGDYGWRSAGPVAEGTAVHHHPADPLSPRGSPSSWRLRLPVVSPTRDWQQSVKRWLLSPRWEQAAGSSSPSRKP